jgi:hypothetical protein
MFLCVLLLPSSQLSAQWSTDPAVNTPVSTISDAGSQSGLRMCSDGSGGAILVWVDRRKEKTNTGGDIYAQRLNDQGIALWTADGVMICDTVGTQEFPAIISDGTGGAIITWQDARTGQYTGNIYVQHINAAGQTIWGRQGKQLTTGNNWFVPSLASDGAGGTILSYRNGVTPAGIYAQRVDSSGTVRWAANGVSLAGGYCDYPNVAADDSGGAFVAWTFVRSSGYMNIYVQRISSAGVARWTAGGIPVRVQDAMQGSVNLLNMGRGSVILSWYDERSTTGTRQLFVQRFDYKGTAQMAAGGKPISDLANEAYRHVMAPDGYGGAFIAYESYGSLWAIRVDGAGKARWDSASAARICTVQTLLNVGSIAIPEPGRAVITWTDYRNNDATNENSDVFAQSIDTSGHLLWKANGIQVCSAPRAQLTPIMTPTSNRNVIVAWKDNRSAPGNYYQAFDIYAQRINAAGGLTDMRLQPILATEASLQQNYPNPFNPLTVVSFQLPAVSEVRLAVYDLLGREVATLVNERRAAGSHSVRFDASGLASGAYFYRLTAGNFVQTRKLMLVK